MTKLRKGCNSALDKKVATLEQDYAEIRPMDEEFAKLHSVAESERTPEQHERHGLLLADLMLSNQWTPIVFSLTQSEMNAAFTHHVKQYQR